MFILILFHNIDSKLTKIQNKMLKKFSILIFISALINCRSLSNQNIFNAKKKKEISDTNNSYIQKAKKYINGINCNLRSINRKIKDSIFPSFLLYNQLINSTNSTNESYVSVFKSANFEVLKCNIIDSEILNCNNIHDLIINQTNGEILDNFNYISGEDLYFPIISEKISSDPLSVATLSGNLQNNLIKYLLLTNNNFSHINYAKNITLPIRTLYSTNNPLLVYNSTIKFVINQFVGKESILMSFDAKTGENLFNRSYKFTAPNTALYIRDLISNDNKTVLLGSRSNSNGIKGFFYIVDEDDVLNNQAITFLADTIYLIERYEFIPYQIIKDEENYSLIGYARFDNRTSNTLTDCFILKINSNFSKILNSKLIRDDTKRISCHALVKKDDFYYILGTLEIVDSNAEERFVFISKLDSIFEMSATKYYTYRSETDGNRLADIFAINADIIFSAEVQRGLQSIFKIPQSFEENCLEDYFNLTIVPVNFSLGGEPLDINTNPDIIIEDINVNFNRDVNISNTIACKNGMLPTLDPTSDPTTDPTNDPTTDPTADPTTDPTNDPTGFPTTSKPTADTDIPTNNPTKEPTNSLTDNPTSSPIIRDSSSSEEDTSLEIILPVVLGVVAILVLLALLYIFRYRKALQYLTVSETQYDRDL